MERESNLILVPRSNWNSHCPNGVLIVICCYVFQLSQAEIKLEFLPFQSKYLDTQKLEIELTYDYFFKTLS
jgi:hypothetical protein